MNIVYPLYCWCEYSGGLNTKYWNTEHFEVLFSIGWSNGCHFVLFSNGLDHWKTELLARLDYFIYKIINFIYL